MASASVDPTALPHRESEEALPVAAPGTAQSTQANTPAATTADLPTLTAAGVEESPPLPPDLSRIAPSTVTQETATSPSAATPALLPATPNSEDLPPLPADLSRSDPAGLSTTTPPDQGNGIPLSSPPATAEALTPQVQPAPAPIADSPAPISDMARSPASIPTGDSYKLDEPKTATVALSTPPQASADVPVVPEPSSTPTESALPLLPNAAASPSAGTISESPQPYPTRNPNLERQAPATQGTTAEITSDASSLPPALPSRMLASSSDSFIPDRANPPSTLRPDLQREIEQIARAQEDEMRRQAQAQPPPAPAAPPESTSSDLRTQTQLDISRAPSPAEARPIKAIPVPEDWVPLPPRSWSPQRKYWAAAATCHLPLYFQDPVLERYGHSVEQFVGPLGRFLTYPVDDPTQSTQRNQMLQPWFSAGLMGLQIITWPYNLIMDPPWEAQYDLGYYRPGDNIPTDTYWLPLHGYGPPLRGSNY